jgi:hypothetical protein
MTDVIYVPVEAADGLVLVPHTLEEYARLWAGVDREAAYLLSEDLIPIGRKHR